MYAITPGSTYVVESHDNGDAQTIRFKTAEHDGTTNEEVIAMLIDRIGVQNAGLSCRENAIAITKLEEALMWLNKRTADRKARGVWNTEKP